RKKKNARVRILCRFVPSSLFCRDLPQGLRCASRLQYEYSFPGSPLARQCFLLWSALGFVCLRKGAGKRLIGWLLFYAHSFLLVFVFNNGWFNFFNAHGL